LLCTEPFAVIEGLRLQFERFRRPEIHAQVEIHSDKNRCLEPIGIVKTLAGKIEARIYIMRDQNHLAGVTMGRPVH
jgi:hypothetical protein